MLKMRQSNIYVKHVDVRKVKQKAIVIQKNEIVKVDLDRA